MHGEGGTPLTDKAKGGGSLAHSASAERPSGLCLCNILPVTACTCASDLCVCACVCVLPGVGVDASMNFQAWQSLGLMTDCIRSGGHLTLLNTLAELPTDARSGGRPHMQISHGVKAIRAHPLSWQDKSHLLVSLWCHSLQLNVQGLYCINQGVFRPIFRLWCIFMVIFE